MAKFELDEGTTKTKTKTTQGIKIRSLLFLAF